MSERKNNKNFYFSIIIIWKWYVFKKNVKFTFIFKMGQLRVLNDHEKRLIFHEPGFLGQKCDQIFFNEKFLISSLI